MHQLARYLDPRRSLASAVGWLVFALSLGLAVVASVWVDDIVGRNLLDERGRQLDRAAGRVAADLNLNVARRLQSVRALAALLATEIHDENQATIRRILENLQQASPEFEWIGVADPQGRIVAATHGEIEGENVAGRAWFALGLKGSNVADVHVARRAAPTTAVPGPLVDLIAPVLDAGKNAVGVVGTQLGQRWLLDLAADLGHELRESDGAELVVVDADGTALIGPTNLKNVRWAQTLQSVENAAPPGRRIEWPSQVVQLDDGRRFLVAGAPSSTSDALRDLGWRIVVMQPFNDAAQPARILEGQITAVLLGLGLAAALLGVLLARRVTRGLDDLARSADAIRTGLTRAIAVPSGRNEAARLGSALYELLDSLTRERSALQTLNAELDQRVAARTREIERLAEQARYSAVVRERLKIARDLHDTLAHSMMAMLTEIRLLRRLSATNPGALAEELAQAEETAQQGLNEARAAITQMRFNPVRDAGLTAALDELVKSFVERTGIRVDFTSKAPAGTFADERAETLFRIAEEAMRNVEHHAGATQVTIRLLVSGDGHGLKLTIADNGVGFDVAAVHPGHYGLAGLREQAQVIGAVLNVQSALEQGTTIGVALTPEIDA